MLARWDQPLLAHADRERIIPAELLPLKLTLSGDQTVTLRRGHRYRLTFEVQVLGEALLVGKIITDAQATWTRSRVSVDEDEVDLLTQHDTAVRVELAAHDQAIRAALASHDADVKQKLNEILAKLEEQSAQLAEIKRLLLTPQGRREGFPIK